MYIIAKKKDYYDGVVGTMGIDKSIVYTRETQILENNKEFPKSFQHSQQYLGRRKNHFTNLAHYTMNKDSRYEMNSPFIIGFCGKIYVGWKFYREIPRINFGSSDTETFITYDREFIKKNVEVRSWSSNLLDDLNFVDTYNSMDIFRKLKVPVFIYDADYNRTSIDRNWPHRKEVFIINPILKEYEFYKVFDTFTAFQEISMFMGGVLGSGEKEIVEVADKYKIGQHGFDKWSFRRKPEKKS